VFLIEMAKAPNARPPSACADKQLARDTGVLTTAPV